MKILFQSLCCYLLLMLISLVIQSCCKHEYKIIGDGKLEAHEISDFYSDTIRSEFYLAAAFETSTASIINSNGIIPATFATTCSLDYENSLEESTLKLICGNDIKFENDTIPANSDLLQIENLELEVSVEYQFLSVTFYQNVLDKMEFQTSENYFRIEIGTNDGLNLKSEATILINL